MIKEKFRAWDESNNTMYEVSEIILGWGDPIICSYLGNGNKYVLVKPILMQFTGLYDRKCKEVYEGDIVKFIPKKNTVVIFSYKDEHPDVKIVEWNKDEACYSFYQLDGERQTCGYTVNKKNLSNLYEVIGNIYENPELLEVKK